MNSYRKKTMERSNRPGPKTNFTAVFSKAKIPKVFSSDSDSSNQFKVILILIIKFKLNNLISSVYFSFIWEIYLYE